MSLILEVKDLHVRYGKVEAVHGANLKVEAGRIVTVIGPNGAGKSTMLNAIMGRCRRPGRPPARCATWATTWPASRSRARLARHVP